jgi:hypothetical protein
VVSTVFGGATFTEGELETSSPAPLTFPSGFDAVLQFSPKMVNVALNYHLVQDGLDILSVRVPYQPTQVSPKLGAIVSSYFRTNQIPPGLDLEIVFFDATVSNLSVPPVGTAEGDIEVAAPKKKAGKRPVSTVQPSGDINWVIQVNLYQAPIVFAPMSGAGNNAGLQTLGQAKSGVQTIPAGAASTATSGPRVPGGLPSGTRTVLTEGTAVIPGAMSVGITADLLQFWVQLDFQGNEPSYQSTDPAFTEFLTTPLAISMLAQAATPIMNGYLARISPTVGLAKSMNASQIGGLGLPQLNVSQAVLTGQNGQILTLCVNFGRNTTGNSLPAFINTHDFAYYVGETLFSPILHALWEANAIKVPVVGIVPVQMPVSQNSTQLGQGKAQVQVTLSDTLGQCSLQSSDTDMGDPLQLMSEQTVKLLNLWDPNGNEIPVVGSMANPATEPFVVNLQMFDSLPQGAQQSIQSAMQTLIAALVFPIYVPLVEEVTATNVGGYSSSPLRALVVTWDLPVVILGNIGATGGGSATNRGVS